LPKQEFAHYYGDWIWKQELTDWVKSLLLFFDGIAIGIPESRAEQRIDSDPILAQPLAELGLLRNYWPEVSVKLEESPIDPDLSEYMARVNKMYERSPHGGIPSNSNFDSLDVAVSPELRGALEDFARRLTFAMQNFGGDIHSRANTLAVAGVSMSLVQYVTDVAIQPVIDDENAAGYVAAILGTHNQGRAHIVVDDIRHVGIDLRAVPLDEVLDFRRQHGPEYRAYSKDVRQFALHLSQLSVAERASALAERRAELDDRAEELRRVGRDAFKHQVASFGFGLAGASWILAHGDPWGALFAAGATAAGLTAPTSGSIGAAYSYIFQTRTELAR
jgi:hypothetical protein